MYPNILGSSTEIKEVMRRVRTAAETQANVLIQGETGTGKELVAHAIHQRSRRRCGPFVVANCAAIPHELMESEMFGHVRGAYTGAISDHIGYFEAARDGTLLLDEIGDLHPDLQAKILQVVDSGNYRRVGSTKAEHNRARLVAATHRCLDEEHDGRRFREDLYFRLNVLPIHIPPLRERGTDVLLLARAFLQQFCLEVGKPLMKLGPDACEALQSHSWPGNVRELRACIERLALLEQGESLGADAVASSLGQTRHRTRIVDVRKIVDVERDMILEALKRFRGNRTRAARALGISRRTIQSRLQRYRLEGFRI